ncbi:MAG: tetratricopeptide repeat protein [Phycisphaeraceae bacterium]|nr:tetratricopeptide repeat protein [Phycisphaeraceae bacterium]
MKSPLLWLIVLLTAMLSACDRSAPPPPQVKSSATDEKQAQTELDVLQTRFQNALENHDDLALLTADARKYVQRYPKVAAGHVMLGNMLMLQQDLDAAAAEFDAALALDGSQAEVRINAGTLALQRGDLDIAQRHFSQAVGLDTSNPRFRVHLAEVYIRKQDYAQAEMELLEALRINASSHRAYALLSDLYARQNKLKLAIDQIDKAIKLAAGESKFENAYVLSRATLLLRDNQPGEALKTLNSLPPRRLIQPDAAGKLAECWAMLGQPQQAAAFYEQLTSIDPANETFLAEAARWMIQADQFDDAQRMIDRLRRTNSRNAEIDKLQKLLDEHRK